MGHVLGRLLPLKDREPRLDAIINPSMAQFYLWLAQAQRDHGNLSGREMARVEGAAGTMARRARTMFNPFTGEMRRVDENGEIIESTTIFLGGK